jgi:translocation and assembly module TamA
VVTALGPPPGLLRGEPARTDPVLDAETALIDRLRREGHPLAAVADREVIVDHEAQAMDVVWRLAPGPAATFARPAVEGETRVNPRLTDRVAGRLEGEPFSPQRLERARRELLALGAFDTVRARAADRLDQAGRLPVTFAVTDRPRNAAGVTVAYETNFGLSGRIYYERRNVFGNAETLRLEAEVSRLGDTVDTSDANYRVGATLRRPGLFAGRTSLVLESFAVRERLDAYDRDAVVLAALLEHPWDERWLLRGGPTFENGRIGRDGSLAPFTLFGVVLGARYDSTDSLLDPRRGLRADATAIPYADLSAGGGFVRATGTARTYLDLTGDGGSVVALRGTLGSLIGADQEVPLDKRFYAGGGGSVRGYAFQSIGPRDASGRPLGGASLVEGSVELRQRVSGNIGVVGFVDAGSIGDSETPDFSNLSVGAGLGLRYATAIGPLRLDVGVPLNRDPGGSRYGIYVGLGQAF